MADISKIKLPSGNEYDIKDAIARQMIAGGVSFNIVWTEIDYTSSSAPSSEKLATIPSGVAVYYNNGANNSTGTLAASNTTAGRFYLIYSKTQAGTLDKFDEYATIGDSPNQTWEKIGDTLLDLTGLVTDVLLNKNTASAIGSAATFSITQPSIELHDLSTSETGLTYINAVSENFVDVSATASGGATSWDSKDSKTVVTSVSATTSNLATGSIYGVQAALTTASKAAAATTQVTVTGTGTSTIDNTSWLKGVSVSSECLIIGAAAMDTQATTQYTFTDVAVPIKNSAATTIATGSLVASGGGATIATNVSIGSSVSVIGNDATFNNSQPTIRLSSNTAVSSTPVNAVKLVSTVNPTTRHLAATASGANVQWNNKDSVTVLTSTTSLIVTKGE